MQLPHATPRNAELELLERVTRNLERGTHALRERDATEFDAFNSERTRLLQMVERRATAGWNTPSSNTEFARVCKRVHAAEAAFKTELARALSETRRLLVSNRDRRTKLKRYS